jgi:hypothetical protein
VGGLESVGLKSVGLELKGRGMSGQGVGDEWVGSGGWMEWCVSVCGEGGEGGLRV